jgi:hypothetical protein
MAAATATAGDNTEDPLLTALVEQGVLTQEQADEVASQRAKEDTKSELPKALKGLSIGTLTYLSFQDGIDSGGDFSEFKIKRGYINIEKRIAPNLSFRITPDAHLDSAGDYKVRLKYAYAKFSFKGNQVLSKPYFEVGLAHMPWLDFEEHINRFRMQDTMFMERNGLFNSADAGVMFGANLGADLDEQYRQTVNSKYAGRHGSFQVGVFNGGGYHAAEKNGNKVLEGRFTYRPAPDALPGLQLSVFGLSGEGNVDGNAPDWQVLAGMVSYESPLWVVTGQYYQGDGNQKGSAVAADGSARSQDGYSFFTEVRCPKNPRFSAIARYDRFDSNTDDPAADLKERTIVGLAWQFIKGNYFVLDYDRLEHSLSGLETEDRLQLTLQIKY